MNIHETETRTFVMVEKLVKVWEESVRSTHLFLSEQEIGQIKEYDFAGNGTWNFIMHYFKRIWNFWFSRGQGHEEPTGSAKITSAFNLPCEYVIHTVGPIVAGKLYKTQEEQLKNCYESCLKIAVENKVESIAFYSGERFEKYFRDFYEKGCFSWIRCGI